MRGSDIRKAYLNFFTEKGHKIVPSALLVPENDPTTFFTGSGMQPIVPYLLGEPHPLGTRIANSQKCFRAGDIEEVGDNRHTTFFEMLGNWSFGDYFKQEQITWMWEFLIEKLEFDPRHLYFTCFRGNEELGIPKDTESALLWQKLFLMQGIEAKIGENPETDGIREGEKIFYYPENKNWWSRSGSPENMPEGEPGGPDTEMFWDFGGEHDFHAQSKWKNVPCHVNCDCGRFMEIGNNVFMEYRKTAAGFEKLQQKNVDYGGGLERLIAAKSNDPDMFLGDIFDTLRETLERLSGKEYGKDPKHTFAFRVVMDHMRAATFLIADGVLPSNTDQGYVLRRLLRRAVRFADILGVESGSLSLCVAAIVSEYQGAYSYLVEKEGHIVSVIGSEVAKFHETLAYGMTASAKRLDKGGFTGKDAFDLFSTYGFPLEMTEEIAKEKGITIEQKELFQSEFAKHQELSRTASVGKFKGGLADHTAKVVAFHTATHLMLAALRKELGNDVHQAGSNITEERTRFDFTYPNKVPREALDRVEAFVNEAIAADAIVNTVVMEKEAARAAGVEGSFWEKYPEKVTVYQVEAPNGTVYSRELCGGPHVANTHDIAAFGRFKIIKEEASSAGVRRIKAILE
ncbi:MAG: alanine--tRNA ligase [bacterium]|nr:alanine--tRNA ligase [bacterium]